MSERLSVEQAVAGWYPDPDQPGAWRRWDGESWRGRSMRLRRGGALQMPDALQQQFWTTANPALRVASWLSFLSLIGLLATIVITKASGKTGDDLPLSLIAVVLAITCGISLVSVLVAVLGLIRSGRLGGLVGGVWLLGVTIPMLLGEVVFLVILLTL